MPPDRSVSLTIPRRVLWLFAFLLFGPWLVLGAWVLATRHSPLPERKPDFTNPSRPAHAPAGPDFVRASPGAWGELETYRILIEPPEEFVLTDYMRAGIQPWVFKGYTPATLAALWHIAGLTSEQLLFVEDPSNRTNRSDAIEIQPSRDFVVGLSSAARSRIYAALGEFPENVSQFNPFRLRSSAAAEWLDRVELPAEAVSLTKKLLYQRGTATCFSDESIVLPTISEATDRVKYIKALSRKSALVVQLSIRPGQDIEKLVEYWGKGGRSKDLKPLLQSIARRPNGGAIDIVHLVPRFARLLAYTYPLPSERPIDANHDCHWTSFNFQNEQPDERLSDIGYVRQVLTERYYPVLGEPALGDIIMFVRQDGVVVHSCVYIAADIVFTKNGPAFSVPWLFASLADVQAFYAANPGIDMRRYRSKHF